MITVSIPTPLRRCTGGHPSVSVKGQTVAEVLLNLVAAHPALAVQLFDGDGRLRRFVNIFVNGQDVRLRAQLETPLEDDDKVQIVPAIAGGMPRDFASWRADLTKRVPDAYPHALISCAASDVLFIDVRTDVEWNDGHISGAIHVDRGYLEMQIEAMVPDRSARIVCYCESGTRSLFAANTLAKMGYAEAASLAGGFRAWQAAGGAVVKPATLSEAETRRYKRQVTIPEVGQAGQRRLLESRVLLIGLGGLGCPIALYLAAAGVGRLGFVDDDVVDISNLHRQVLYTDNMVGTLKVNSAKAVLNERYPDVLIDLYARRLDDASASDLFANYDVVVDGTDNFSARYCINDAAVSARKPVVHGAVYRFNGQVAVFDAEKGPCYRCLFPLAPPTEMAPSCAEGGVLGVLPGTIGLMMATETLKLILSIGEPQLGKLHGYDALNSELTMLSFGKDPRCSACGTREPAVDGLTRTIDRSLKSS